MTTLDPKDTFLTLINTFEVDPEKAEGLITILHEASATMRNLRGFVSANLHLSDDHKRVVNYAQWRTRADFDAMLQDPGAQPHMRAAADMAKSYDPAFYTLHYADTVSP